MASPTRPVLSPSLVAQLSTLGTKLRREAADRELDEVLKGLSALPQDQIVRASREIPNAAGFGWWQLPSLTEQPQRWPPTERQLMTRNPDYAWLFLFHPDGYLRAVALDSINTPPTSPFFLSALAWRLNDWVEPVRSVAEQCFRRISINISAAVAANAAVYLLDRRFVWGRWRDEATALDLLFARDDVLEALALQLEKRSTGAFGSCLRSTLRYPAIDQYLPRLATAAIQPAVRAVAYQCLILGKASWPVGFDWVWIDKVYGLRRRVPRLDSRNIESGRSIPDIVAEGIRDRSAFVRKIVADAMIVVRSQIMDERALVSQLVTDPNPAVRSRGDFLARHPRLAQ